jgi:hypothetical protein
MKKLIGIIFFILASTAALAASESPVRTLADVTTTGGFATTSGIRVLSNGSVISFLIQNEMENDTMMANLTESKLAEVVRAIDALKQEPLQHLDKPGCMDAPSTSWNVYNSSNPSQAIVLHRYVTCVNLASANSSSQVKTLLDGFLALSRLY